MPGASPWAHGPAFTHGDEVLAPPDSTAQGVWLSFTGRTHPNPIIFPIQGRLSLPQRELFLFLPHPALPWGPIISGPILRGPLETL